MTKDFAIGRRELVASSAIALMLRASPANAQTWPTRFVRAIVPFPASGNVDVVARLIGGGMSSAGQTLVVENHPGAGGNIGNDIVAHAEPDGYTILFTQNGIAVNRFLYRKLTYDPLNDFAPVSLLVTVPNVIAVPKASPIHKVNDLIAYAKTKSLLYASAGNGTSSHLAGELLKRRLDIQMTHIPYRGSMPALIDLLAGRVDLVCDNVSVILPHVRSGELRAIAVTTPNRLAVLPDVPTMAESGISDFRSMGWTAVFAPVKTPDAIVTKINKALLDAMRQPSILEKIRQDGNLPVGSSPEELRTFVKEEGDAWGPIIKESKIRIDG